MASLDEMRAEVAKRIAAAGKPGAAERYEIAAEVRKDYDAETVVGLIDLLCDVTKGKE